MTSVRSLGVGYRIRHERVSSNILLRPVAALCLLFTIWGLGGPALADDQAEPPRVLVIIAHPDDETMFNLGRFKERGWFVGVALVTNGESGHVVQGIKTDYDPAKNRDILVEAPPGAGTCRKSRIHSNWRSSGAKNFWLASPHTAFRWCSFCRPF